MRKVLGASLMLVLAACGKNEEPVAPVDAGQVGPPDYGFLDTGMIIPVDAGFPDNGGYPDAEPDAGPIDTGVEPDAGQPDTGPPPPQAVTITGRVTKLGAYLAGVNDYVGEAQILAYGVVPRVTGASNPQGEYTLENIPTNGQFILAASKQGYNQTYTAVTTTTENIANQRLYSTEAAWLGAIATTHNVNLVTPAACQTAALMGEQCLYAAIVGRINDDGTAGNGTVRPVAGVAREEFTITYGAQNQPWYVRGPYFLNYDGTPNAANLTSVNYQDGQGNYRGGLFVTFVEFPINGNVSRTFQISIRHAYQGGYRYFGPVQVSAFRAPGAAVTWATIPETGLAPPVPVENIDFDTQIYPLLRTVDQGGLGCQGCHTNQNGAIPSGGMNLYGGPDVAYASLNPQTYPQRVNLQNPAASYVLVRPLYEADGVQDHPIYAFASDQDPAYRLIYTWIQEGAIRNVPQPPVSFYNEIRTLLYRPTAQGGAGCYACHVNGVNAQNAPGGFYMGGNGNELYERLVNTAPTDPGPYAEPYRINKATYPERSLVLTKPLFGNNLNHPVKIFYDAADPRYQTIYRWIVEGYQNDTP